MGTSSGSHPDSLKASGIGSPRFASAGALRTGCDPADTLQGLCEVSYRGVGVSIYRRIASRGGSLLVRVLFPTKNVRDFTCGYRAYRAGVIKQAFEIYGEQFVAQSRFSCMVDILLELRRLDATMSEVPLILRYDLEYSVSKMMVVCTIVDTLKLLAARRLGIG